MTSHKDHLLQNYYLVFVLHFLVEDYNLYLVIHMLIEQCYLLAEATLFRVVLNQNKECILLNL